LATRNKADVPRYCIGRLPNCILNVFNPFLGFLKSLFSFSNSFKPASVFFASSSDYSSDFFVSSDIEVTSFLKPAAAIFVDANSFFADDTTSLASNFDFSASFFASTAASRVRLTPAELRSIERQALPRICPNR
jgi:hypothetical protein